MASRRELLRTLIREPFSRDLLSAIDRAVCSLEDSDALLRVASFVVSRVCREMCDFLDGTEPASEAKLESIEAHLRPILKDIIEALAEERIPKGEVLASLIERSNHIRTKLQWSG